MNEQSNALDSVLEFDPENNSCKNMPILPYPLSRMGVARWKDNVFLLGGRDKRGKVLRKAFVYNCKTGKTTTLPSMREKRSDCCAVVLGERIVVMGGENERCESLNSVERLKMGGSKWKYLPAMNEARWGAVAEILPSEGMEECHRGDTYSTNKSSI